MLTETTYVSMGNRSEEFIQTPTVSECYSLHAKLGNNNTIRNEENSEKNSSANKTNAIIIRYTDDNISSPHVRMCKTCLKKIDPDYYFLWEFMEFCNVLCVSKYQGLNFKCMYCSRFINNTLFGKFYIRTRIMFRYFCSVPCMNHYRMTVKCCLYCQIEIHTGINSDISFCSEICNEVFNSVIKPPRVPQKTICCVCNQDKPVNIVLKHDGTTAYFCNKPCSIAYSFVKLQADIEQCIMCRYYFSQRILKKYTVYLGNVALFFCSTGCHNVYMLLKGKFVNCCWCKNQRNSFGMIRKFSVVSTQNNYICSVNCFKLYECSAFADVPPLVPVVGIPCPEISNTLTLNTNQNINENANNLQLLQVVENKQVLVQTKTPADQRNVATMCFIPKSDKDVIVKPDMADKDIQTDKTILLIPTPVPIYVPTPMAMYSIPVLTAVPFVLPVPVPIFIPVAKQSVVNIMTDIEAMHNKVPKNPYEADLLKIADVIAEEKVCKEHIPTAVSFESEENLLKIKFDSNGSKDIFNVTEKVGVKRLFDSLDSDGPQNKKKSGDILVKKISLNYSLSMNALQHWVKNFNNKPQKSRDNTILKSNILQMLPEEINLMLCLFVQELKKPGGSEYAPDTFYYLCLGIQYYLNKNRRTDDIFFDKPYNKFCNILNKIAEKFNSLYQEGSHYIVTRVEEEHLWETKQLGNHSALVLLNTLVYFNTKYYHCTTLEQHADISFSQILKLWRKKSKSKGTTLRFYPKQVPGAKRVYEQYANETDRTRCPVKIYEFYLSKCPENVKSSKSLFYLQPEQYCTSDSPLWYTNESLASDMLVRMLNRVKMVKEINIALLNN